MTLDEEIRLIEKVHQDMRTGNFNNLFKYFKSLREDQVKLAQTCTINDNKTGTALAILSSSIYDQVLSWMDENGGALSEHSEQLKESRETETENGDYNG